MIKDSGAPPLAGAPGYLTVATRSYVESLQLPEQEERSSSRCCCAAADVTVVSMMAIWQAGSEPIYGYSRIIKFIDYF